MGKDESISKSKNQEKISVCDVMKEDTSRIIQKLESQIPSKFQQYSDLYAAYLHTLDDVFGTCYLSEKEFFDRLDIDQGLLSAYKKYSNVFTDTYLQQMDYLSKLRDEHVQIQISSLQIYDNLMHVMMDSYAKMLAQFNRAANSFENSR